VLDVVELAAELVRTPSVNPGGRENAGPTYGEAAMAGKVNSELKRLGASDIRTTYPLAGRPNVLGYFDCGAQQTILFEAHLDTVPTDHMSISPFAGEVRDGRLYGRGACDVKGPMAAMLAAIAHATTSGRCNHNILFAAVCDEEAGFSGVRHFLDTLPEEWRRDIHFAVVAEPTDLAPVAAHKGVVRWNVEAQGVAAHSSTPHLGRNAIYSMADALQRLRAHAEELSARPPHATLGSPTLSVGVVQGGSAVNVVPDFCTAQVDRRLVPGEKPEAALEELRKVLGELIDVSISQPLVAAPAFEVSTSGAAVSACLGAAAAVGIDSTPQFANYCTDASFYPAHGIEAVVFGPGSIQQAHTADEFIEVEQLRLGVNAYQQILATSYLRHDLSHP